MARKPKTEDDVIETVTAASAKRLGVIASSAPLQSATLAGDIRDTLLDLFKTRTKTWSEMTQDEQRDIGRALEYAARELVIATVDVIRSDGMSDPVKAIVKSYADSGDIKATLIVKTDPAGDVPAQEAKAIDTLHKARGKLVLITIASHEDYLGERGPLETQPDQNPLVFEAGSDDHPEDDSDLAGDEPAEIDEVKEEDLTH